MSVQIYSEDDTADLRANLGAQCRARRHALGFTQGQAAGKIGISTEFYARLERGHALPSIHTLAKIADALEVSVDISRENLERYSPDLQIQLVDSSEGGRAAILARQDGYDAARLLLGSLHERLAPELGGDFLVAAPARDMFLALTHDPDDFVERLRKRVHMDYRRLPYPITDELFLVTRDGVAGTKSAA